MKKLIVILVFIFVLPSFLSSCGQNDSIDSKSDQEQLSEEERTEVIQIAVIPRLAFAEENEEQILLGIQESCEQYGIKCDVFRCDGDVSKQYDYLTKCIKEKYDGIIYSSLSGGNSFEAGLIQAAKDEGIVVVDFNVLVLQEDGTINTDASIKYDACSSGREALRTLVRECGENATILFPMIELDQLHSASPIAGFLDEAKNFPSLRLLASEPMGQIHVEAQKKWVNDWVESNPEIEGIFCPYDALTVGAYEVCKEKNRIDIKLVGYNAGPEQIEFMRNDLERSNLIESFILLPEKLGNTCVDVLMEILNGRYSREGSEDIVWVANETITLANVADVS